MSITLKKASQNISVKWSASHMLNNLTLNRSSESRRATTYGVSHKSGFTMVTTSDDGTKKIQGQVICRVPAGNESSASENDARFLAYVVQAAFVQLPVRNILVLACTKSVQIYEPDGTTCLFTHALEKNQTNRTETSVYARGIAGLGQNLLAVGTHRGEILIFTIPPKGNGIFLKETISGHQTGITSLVSNSYLLISSDTSGTIFIWNIRTMSEINTIQPMDDSGITSLTLWNNCIIASYANGMIRFFDPENAQICGSISAHSRCINAIDCNDQGLLVSVSDDCFVRMWKLSGDAENLQIVHLCNYHIENNQLVGVKFAHPNRPDVLVASYDSNELLVLRPS